MTELGKKLLASGNCSTNEVKERNDKLTAEVNTVLEEWAQKKEWIQQCLALQVFNKEADHIDAATSGSEMFLEYTDLGVRKKLIVLVEMNFNLTFFSRGLLTTSKHC